MKKNIIIGSRGSILALAQTNLVKDKLEKYYPNLSFEIKEIVTSGDKDLKSNWENSDVSLKSFFTKEIEQELLDGDIDIAVHSMKDMPAISPKGLICGAIPDREDPRDVDERLADFKNIEIYNLDDIWEVYNQNSMNRDKLLEDYSYLIDEQMEKLIKTLNYYRKE